MILVDDIAHSSDNLSSSSISYTYILYIPVDISYVHPITVLVHTGEQINDMLVLYVEEVIEIRQPLTIALLIN